MKGVRHPQLVAMSGVWRHGDLLILALELCERTLHDCFSEWRQSGLPGIPERELLDYLHDAARGLDALNAQGIQHRDVKPKNCRTAAPSRWAILAWRSFWNESMRPTPACSAPPMPHRKPFMDVPPRFPTSILSQSATYSCARASAVRGSPAEMMNGHLNYPPDLSQLPARQRPIVAHLEKNPHEGAGRLAKLSSRRWPLRANWRLQLRSRSAAGNRMGSRFCWGSFFCSPRACCFG